MWKRLERLQKLRNVIGVLQEVDVIGCWLSFRVGSWCSIQTVTERDSMFSTLMPTLQIQPFIKVHCPRVHQGYLIVQIFFSRQEARDRHAKIGFVSYPCWHSSNLDFSHLKWVAHSWTKLIPMDCSRYEVGNPSSTEYFVLQKIYFCAFLPSNVPLQQGTWRAVNFPWWLGQSSQYSACRKFPH